MSRRRALGIDAFGAIERVGASDMLRGKAYHRPCQLRRAGIAPCWRNWRAGRGATGARSGEEDAQKTAAIWRNSAARSLPSSRSAEGPARRTTMKRCEQMRVWALGLSVFTYGC